MIDDLYFIDYHARTVKAVPYSRDRAMDAESDMPTFYFSRRKACVRLMEYLQEIVHEAATRWDEIKEEIGNE